MDLYWHHEALYGSNQIASLGTDNLNITTTDIEAT